VFLSAPLPRSALVRNAADARIALLESLIDHAPLFPPASLPLQEALVEDERASESSSAFALGRFVCPASRLAELPDVGRGVSVVLDAPLEVDPRVEAVEVPASYDLEALPNTASEVYVEVPLDAELEKKLDHLQSLGLRAKVRCGGASVPDAWELARFLRACRERRLVFKATAGLHHALRRDGEHGFLNLLAAVVFGDEDEALGESDAAAFTLVPGAFSWRNHTATVEELARSRRERLHSIGSCSFFEPVAELEALGVLPL
jgi:hypothetical protein